MEANVTSMILDSAHRLGLDRTSPVVIEAIEVGIEAVRSGYDVENSFAFGRSVLIRATQPLTLTGAFAAA